MDDVEDCIDRHTCDLQRHLVRLEREEREARQIERDYEEALVMVGWPFAR